MKKETHTSGKESMAVPSHYSLPSNFGKEKIKIRNSTEMVDGWLGAERQEIFSYRVFVFRVKVLCRVNGMVLMSFCQVGGRSL